MKSFIGKVIGVDGGLLNLGVSVLDAVINSNHSVSLTIKDLAVFHTYPIDPKKKVRTYASDDLVRRLREIGQYVNTLVDTENVLCVCLEDFSYPQQKQVAIQLAAVYGVIAEATRKHSIPLFRESPKDIKRRLCGNSSASKKDVEAKIIEIFGPVNWPGTKDTKNHCCDAIAAAYTCIQQDAVLALLRIGNNIVMNRGA